MVLKYLNPTLFKLEILILNGLTDFLSGQIMIFAIVFAIFILFLIGSLIFSLRYLIEELKKEVFRSRILVKIIPAHELLKISKINTFELIKERNLRQKQIRSANKDE